MVGMRFKQRRRDPKTRSLEFCPAWLELPEGNRQLYMVDLSAKGARFRNPLAGHPLPVRPEQEVAVTVKTPYGRSRCIGKVSWTEQDENGEMLGIAFTEPPNEADDPLRMLINSPIC
ncbi:MAG: hypothetical protein GF344_19980 [Chitinivibrionales bacterium]|nr:hypothetical protein [Chitinivibrionales bacterium]MBD3358893.1 hypothetical protein [Chitinivibrionales bacterium]